MLLREDDAELKNWLQSALRAPHSDYASMYLLFAAQEVVARYLGERDTVLLLRSSQLENPFGTGASRAEMDRRVAEFCLAVRHAARRRSRMNRKGLPINVIVLMTVVGTVLALTASVLPSFSRLYRQTLIRSAETTGRQAVAQVSSTVNDYLSTMESSMSNISAAMDWGEAERGRFFDVFFQIRPNVVAISTYDEDGALLSCYSPAHGVRTQVEQNLSMDAARIRNGGSGYVSAPHVVSLFEGYYPWVVTMVRPIATEGKGRWASLDFSFLLNRVLYEPIRALERAMRQFEQDADHFSYQPYHPSLGAREIQSLSQSFGHMVVRIQQLMKQVREEEINLRKTELCALQAQINPHFLYNTLDAITWMCERGKTDDAVMMVNALARLFRISISRGRELIPLRSELQHAECYLRILSIRYRGQFRYRFLTDEDCMDCLCAKIVIQPILENAIYTASTV